MKIMSSKLRVAAVALSVASFLFPTILRAQENARHAGMSSIGLTGIGDVEFAQENAMQTASVGVGGNFFRGNYAGQPDMLFRGSGLLRIAPIKNLEVGLLALYGLNQNPMQDPVRIKLGVDFLPSVRLGWNIGNFSLGLYSTIRFRSGIEHAGIDLPSTGVAAKLLIDYRPNARLSFHGNFGFALDNGRNLTDIQTGLPMFDVYRLSTDISDARLFTNFNFGAIYKVNPWLSSVMTARVDVPVINSYSNLFTYRVSPLIRFEPLNGLIIDAGVVVGFGGGGGIIIPTSWLGNLLVSYNYWPTPKPPVVQTIEIQKIVEKTIVVTAPIEICREDDRLKTPLITFNPNTVDMLPGSTEVVNKVAELLLAHPEIAEVEIGVHTDEDGDDKFNDDISNDRANKVKDLLIARGIEPARLRVKGFGKTKPVVKNRIEVGRAQNRRIEFVIVRTKS